MEHSEVVVQEPLVAPPGAEPEAGGDSASSLLPGQDNAPPSSEAQPVSKSAQKKLKKAARLAEKKAERKVRDKELKKEKQRIKAEKRAAGNDLEGQPVSKKPRIASKPFNARVVIDLGFDEKMIEKEVNSLCCQLNFAYSINRKSPTPFASLLFTSLNGRTKAHLDSTANQSYLRWKRVDWWSEGYEKLWESAVEYRDAEAHEKAPQPSEQVSAPVIDSGRSTAVRPKQPQASQSSDKANVVYLSADSPCELEELIEGETYVIGGLVDRNRYKNICQNKAEEQGIRTARLPIGTYLAQMATRKVLTVNQVFEILVKWVETRDWEQAFLAVMPKRKFIDRSKKGRIAEGGDVDDEDDSWEVHEVEEHENEDEVVEHAPKT